MLGGAKTFSGNTHSQELCEEEFGYFGNEQGCKKEKGLLAPAEQRLNTVHCDVTGKLALHITALGMCLYMNLHVCAHCQSTEHTPPSEH